MYCVYNWDMKAVEVKEQGRYTGVKPKARDNTVLYVWWNWDTGLAMK